MNASPYLVLVAMLAGCPNNDIEPMPDALPPITYESFTDVTWSFSLVGGHHQLSITDGMGTAACGLSQNHTNSLGAAGHQLIMHVTADTGVACPAGSYPLRTNCSAALGTEAHVPIGCAYYRRFDAQGALLGILPARLGEVQVAGTAGSCSIRVNLGFLGDSFARMQTLTNGPASPWCATN